jgi:hypothetical protein
MSLKLRNAFIDMIKNQYDLLYLTTNPSILNRIMDRLGDMLHRYGYDTFLAYEPVGYSFVPLLAVLENKPFVLHIDDWHRPLGDEEKVVVVCGEIKEENISWIESIPNKVVTVSLLDYEKEYDFRHIYLYKYNELEEDIF